MHFSFKIQDPFGGFCISNARAGEQAHVVYRELVSSDDGALLDSRLTKLSSVLLSRSPTPIKESSVDHFFATVRRTGEIDVWVNVSLRGEVRIKRAVKAGDPAFVDDIVDIATIRPEGVEVPADAGFIFMFSCGWRRGLYYDLAVVHNAEGPKNIWRACAAAYAYVFARSRFAITEDEWKLLFAQRWFPFTTLPEETIERMLSHIRADWNVDDLLPKIVDAVRKSLPQLRESIDASPLLARHQRVLGQALDAFERGAWELAAQALMPKVEGLLREHHALTGSPGAKVEHFLASAATAAPHEASLLLPERLKAYLQEVFFAFESFADPAAVKLATRHAVSHGVAGDEILTEKTAAIAVLILHQLVLLLGKPSGPPAPAMGERPREGAGPG